MWGLRLLTAISIALGIALAGGSAGAGSLVPVTINPSLPDTSRGPRPAAGMFLVARRSLYDPYFGQSVVYLVEHDEEGTLGLIVNRSSDIDLTEAIPDLEREQAGAHRLQYGGPVGSTILMLLRSESAAAGMTQVAGDVYISSNRQVLEEVLSARKSASEVRFYFGHSGWSAGQLDFEILRGSWHVIAAEAEVIFAGNTDSLWQRLIEQLEPHGMQVDSGYRVQFLSL